jgi:hypothetical protein
MKDCNRTNCNCRKCKKFNADAKKAVERENRKLVRYQARKQRTAGRT